MGIKSILLVLLAAGRIEISRNEELSCLDASYCNLIRGDIAKESDKYNKDPSKFYAQAEEGVTLFKKYSQTQDAATKAECDRLTNTCSEEAGKMAVEDLKFPSKYQTSCNYESYARTIFDCKNIKNWPKTVKDVLPTRSKNCRTQCFISSEQNYTLSTGKVLTSLDASHSKPSGDPELDALQVEERTVITNREFVAQFAAIDDDVKAPGVWGPWDFCFVGDWVISGDWLWRGDHLFHAAFRCGSILNGVIVELKSNYIQGHAGTELAANWDLQNNKPDKSVYDNRGFARTCGEITREQGVGDSFVVGISLNSVDYKSYGKVPLFVNFVCATSKAWTFPRFPKNPSDFTTAVDTEQFKPDSKEIYCRNGTAMCGVRVKVNQFGDTRALTDVGIACCVGDARFPYFKNGDDPITPKPPTTVTPPGGKDDGPTTPKPPTTGGTPPPGGKDGLITLQKRSNYFLIWDESEVLNDIITRYNIYYTPAHVQDETVFKEHKCPDGEFIEQFELTDPKACFFQGQRIPEIKFKCTKGQVLDIYKPLKTGHTLQDSKYFGKQDCTGGIYTSIQFTYYVDPVYPYLVQAWGMKMGCLKPQSGTVDHELIIKAYEKQDLKVLNTENKATVTCDTGTAICGFQAKVIEDGMATFEGFYFKVTCCPHGRF